MFNMSRFLWITEFSSFSRCCATLVCCWKPSFPNNIVSCFYLSWSVKFNHFILPMCYNKSRFIFMFEIVEAIQFGYFLFYFLYLKKKLCTKKLIFWQIKLDNKHCDVSKSRDNIWIYGKNQKDLELSGHAHGFSHVFLFFICSINIFFLI